MRQVRTILASAVLALAIAAVPSAAATMRLDSWRGHLAIGFGGIVSDSLAPGGSLSVAAGIDYRLAPAWRLGPTVSFDILGSSSVTRGSIRAGLDYSLFEAALLATWLPSRGPVARVSFGPGVASPRAELSIAGGGAGFTDLTVGEVQPEFALDVTFMSRRSPVVAVGAEIGTRVIPTTQGTWTLLTGRLAVHY